LREEALSVQSGDVLLEGQLALPENGKAEKLVLLIGGSGPLDRNQNSSSVQLNLFSELARHLPALDTTNAAAVKAREITMPRGIPI